MLDTWASTFLHMDFRFHVLFRRSHEYYYRDLARIYNLVNILFSIHYLSYVVRNDLAIEHPYFIGVKETTFFSMAAKPACGPNEQFRF